MFSFDLGRGGDVARSFLGDYAGILQTDGYAGYNSKAGRTGPDARGMLVARPPVFYGRGESE